MAKPISVSPSQAWLGNDGPWSTFNIRVGTPAQDIWVTASTRVPETWVVLGDGCISSDPASCPDDRGHTFKEEKSTTWKQQGLYQLNLELNLGYNPSNAGKYGFDTLGLGYRGSGGPTLDDQVFAGIATKDFYLGSLGLVPAPVNFTSEDSHPSLLTNLKAQNLIPSLSYGYSAGAYYRLKKVDGTLTLGGYDASKFTPNDVEFTLATDISRDLLVGIQSIRFSDSKTSNKELLSDGILAFVDSAVPHIWLPLSACRAFEKAFGIIYDDTTDLYLVNNTLHDRLLSQNASVTFVLGDNTSGGKTVEITLPYLSFDLQANYKFLNASSRYFPLRRADNDTQYTLGRTFLQESYLIVNYERSNFSVSQSIFLEGADQNLIPILSLNDTLKPVAQPQPSSKKLSTGAVAGIVVAILIICILIIGTILFIIRRRRRGQRSQRKSRQNDQVELDGVARHVEIDNAETWKPGLEMEGSNTPVGLGDKARRVAEFPGSNASAEVEGSRGGVEMDSGAYPAAVELDAGPIHIHGIPPPNPTIEEGSTQSDRDTPLHRSISTNPIVSNPRNSQLQSAASETSSPTYQNPPLQPGQARPDQRPREGDDRAEDGARRERRRRERWKKRGIKRSS